MKIGGNYTLTGLIAFMIWLTPVDALAQDKKVGFGLQGLGSISWMKPDVKEIESKGPRGGYGFGLMFDFRFGDNYSLTSGLNLLYGGGKIEFQDTINFEHDSRTGDNFDTIVPGTIITYKLGYIEIPITLLLKTNEIGYITYFGQFGLSSQIRIKAKGDAASLGEGQIDNGDFKNEVRIFNFGLLIGGGIEYSLGGNTALVIGLLYNLGFMDVIAKSKPKVAMSSLALRVGVMF
ncbi:MAG TPA: PorT family protein [Flavobacteriales bacterium]|nr:PorT family protein [Flavobacteriales bacterium]